MRVSWTEKEYVKNPDGSNKKIEDPVHKTWSYERVEVTRKGYVITWSQGGCDGDIEPLAIVACDDAVIRVAGAEGLVTI